MRSDKTNISSINFRIPMLNAACEADSSEAKSEGEPHMARQRIDKFTSQDTRPEQKRDNDRS